MNSCLHVYGLVLNERCVVDGWRGFAGEPLDIADLGSRSLFAVVGRHSKAPSATIDSLRGHAAVVARTFAGGPILPARFGLHASDHGALREMFAPRLASLQEHLQSIGDHAEIGVRMVPAPKRDPDAASLSCPSDHRGGAYLRARLHARRELAELRLCATTWLDGHDSQLRARGALWVTNSSRDGEAIVSRAYLVERHEALSIVESLRLQLRTTPIGIGGIVSGPWAPWSFAEPGAAERPVETDVGLAA